MPVYMITGAAANHVKIGNSANPRLRLASLQTSHWDELRVIRLFQGGRQEELDLHRRFAHLRLRNEWFRFSVELLDDLGLPELEYRPEDYAPPDLVVPEGFDKRAFRQAARILRTDGVPPERLTTDNTEFMATYRRALRVFDEPIDYAPISGATADDR